MPVRRLSLTIGAIAAGPVALGVSYHSRAAALSEAVRRPMLVLPSAGHEPTTIDGQRWATTAGRSGNAFHSFQPLRRTPISARLRGTATLGRCQFGATARASEMPFSRG